MSLRSLSGPATVAVVIAALFLTACDDSGNPGSSQNDTPSPTWTAPTSPPPDAGGFFTWQQARHLDGQAAAAARTLRAVEYFIYLAGRYNGYVHPHWFQISGPGRLEYLKAAGFDVPSASRGPVTYRLMDITITEGRAIVVGCGDYRQVERALDSTPPHSHEWDPATEPFSVDVKVLTSSRKSPTGWWTGYRRTDERLTELTDKKCRRVFTTKEPAVTKAGKPDYIETWPQPTPSADTS